MCIIHETGHISYRVFTLVFIHVQWILANQKGSDGSKRNDKAHVGQQLRWLLVPKFIDSLLKFILRSLGVDRSCVEVFVAEDLGERHQIVVRLLQESMSEGMPQNMRTERDAADRGVFRADGPDTVVSQSSSFPDKNRLRVGWGSAFEILGQCPSSLDRQRNRSLLLALPVATDNLP